MLRTFVEGVVGEGRGGASEPGLLGNEIKLRLTEAERAALDTAAGRLKLPASRYVRSLLRSQLLRQPQWDAEGLAVLREVGEAIRALTAVLDDRGVENEAAIAVADELRGKVMPLVVGAINGNLKFWKPEG